MMEGDRPASPISGGWQKGKQRRDLVGSETKVFQAGSALGKFHQGLCFGGKGPPKVGGTVLRVEIDKRFPASDIGCEEWPQWLQGSACQTLAYRKTFADCTRGKRSFRPFLVGGYRP
jgi:hypothetical protein